MAARAMGWREYQRRAAASSSLSKRTNLRSQGSWSDHACFRRARGRRVLLGQTSARRPLRKSVALRSRRCQSGEAATHGLGCWGRQASVAPAREEGGWGATSASRSRRRTALNQSFDALSVCSVGSGPCSEGSGACSVGSGTVFSACFARALSAMPSRY
jgi:hypothetical protein